MNLLVKISDVDINSQISNIGDQLSFGIQIVLFGMAIVFAVLFIIWMAILGLRLLFSNVKTSPKEAASNEPIQVVQPTATTSDAEIIAVIAAAIATAEQENLGVKFRVVSFRKI